MKISIPRLRPHWYIYCTVFFCTQSLLGVDFTWNATGFQEWNDSSNWTPTGVPNSTSDTASISNSPYPIIGESADLTIDLSALLLPLTSSQAILGNGSNNGTLNVYNALQADAVTQITLSNGTLNFQNGFSGNTGSGIAKGVFSSTGINTINFLAGSTGGSNIAIIDSNVGGVGGTLTIQENITLGTISLLSANDTIAIASGKTLTADNTGTLGVSSSIAGTITGDGQFTKSASDTLTLSGPNTYAGGTTISSGILNIRNSSALGSGAASVASGAQLQLQSGISPANSLTLNGTGSGTGALLNVSDTNTYSGAITLGSATTIGSTAGTLTLSNTNALSGTQNVTFVGAGNTTVSGSIATSTGTVTKSGSGTLTLSGTNTYSGATTLSAGRINLNASAGLGSSTLAMADSTTLSLGSGVSVANNIALATTFGTKTIDVSSGGSATVSGTISGGNLTKTGSNTLILTHANTYSTGTIISVGAVNIQNSAALGGGSISVSSGAQLQLQGGINVTNNNLSLNGTGGGTGALLNVSGDNTYTRTASLSAATTIGSTVGTLTFTGATSMSGTNRNVTFTGAGNITVNGIIATTTGTVTKNGSGTLTLAGANTYSGGATVSSGIVNIQNSLALGSGSVSVASGAQLQLQGGISPANSLTLNGTGDSTGVLLNVSGTNTYSGAIILGSATTIGSTAGTLTLSNTNAISGTQNVTFEGAGNTTISGSIATSTGTVTKNGSGTLTLSGANTYSGGTTLNAGTLSISSASNSGGSSAGFTLAGGTLHATGNVTTSGSVSVTGDSTINTDDSRATTFLGLLTGSDGKTLTLSGAGTNSLVAISVNNADTFTISGIIAGSSSLTKSGTGTLILPDANTYSGGTVITDGRLSVNGQIVGGVTVNADAILGGTGTVYGGGIIHGTLSPGNSIGTITFDTSGGNVTLDSSSVINIEIDPTTSSKVAITGSGSAALGGTVHVIQDAGTYPSTGQYTILEGSYTGQFNPTVTGGDMPFRLSYNPDFVYLLFGAVPVSLLIPTNGLFCNALVVAHYLNQNAPVSTLSLFANLTECQLRSAMNSISPSRNAFGPYIIAQTALAISPIITGHIDAFREDSVTENSFSLWGKGFGEFAHQKRDAQNSAFNYSSGGIIGGFDYRGDYRTLVGGAVGYGHTGYKEDHHLGCGAINYYLATIYGNVFVRNFYVSPAIWGVFDKIHNTRRICFSDFSARARANIGAWQLVPHLEIGYDAQFYWGYIVPFSSLDWAITWQKKYQEHGAAPFNVCSGAQRNSMVRSETGLKFYEQWECSWCDFFLREKVSYVFEKPFNIGTVNASFVGMPGAFTVNALNQNLNLGAIGLDFIFVLGEDRSMKIDFDYEGQFGPLYWSNQFIVTMSKEF